MEERASLDALPDEVASGLWAIPVAIPSAQLKVVFSYAFDVGGGLVLVDLGYSDQQSLASLESGLAAIGAGLEDVRGVLFTHGHGDHYGLAGAVKERAGAWIATHEAELWLISQQAGAGGRNGGLRDILEVAGAPPDSVPAGSGGPRPWEFPPPLPDRYLTDGERIRLGAREVTVHHTPGHSDGHVCFVVEGEGIVLVGDHVLSYTTPNVSAWPWTEGDPLGSYLASLRKLEWFGAGMLGLPGHEERMAPVDGRASEIRRHHEEQLDGVMEIVGSGANTIADVAARMSWSRSWADLGPMDRVMALGEAHAHLRQLETREELERLDGRPARWQPVSAS